MLMVTHAAVTGAAGLAIVNPWLAFPLGMAIHLLMDKIPHVWPLEKSAQTMVKYADVTLTLLFVAWIFFVGSTHTAGLISGALGGIVIDVTLVGIMREKGKLAAWHTKRQPHKTHYGWFFTDILIFLLGVAMIFLLK